MFFKGIMLRVCRRYLRMWCMIMPMLWVACNRNEKTVSAVDYTDFSVVDSLMEAADDSLILMSSPKEDDYIPEKADELFDDFVFEFAASKKIQQDRVDFPLPLIVEGDTQWIEREQWKHETLLLHHDYYTVFYINEEQMEYEKRTDLCHVEVERINLDKRTVKACVFERIDGRWHLTQEKMREFNDSPFDRFMDFYREFVSDLDFQHQHVADPIDYITVDSEDDFNTIEGTLDLDQWDAFKPQLPSGLITNIRYGQTYDKAHSMIMVKAGISNGLMDILTFKKEHGQWNLVSYEN